MAGESGDGIGIGVGGGDEGRGGGVWMREMDRERDLILWNWSLVHKYSSSFTVIEDLLGRFRPDYQFRYTSEASEYLCYYAVLVFCDQLMLTQVGYSQTSCI